MSVLRNINLPEYPSNYHLLSLIDFYLLESETERLTAEQACKFIFDSTCYEVPIVNFIKICYIALSKIPSSEENKLVNLILAKLKENAILRVQVNHVNNMIELTKIIRETFLPHVSQLECRHKLRLIHMQEEENIYDYIIRFKQLHAIVLDYEISISQPESNIKNVIQTVDKKHLTYFVNGLHEIRTTRSTFSFYFNNLKRMIIQFVEFCISGKSGKENNIMLEMPKEPINKNEKSCYCQNCLERNKCEEVNYEQNEQSRGVLNTNKKNLLDHLYFKEQEKLQLDKVLNFTIHAPTSYVIPGCIIDEHTNKIGMLTAEEASEIIPYFSNTEPLFFDFLEACYIALSNILIDEEQKLVGIIISRLRGKIAKCLEWYVITNMRDLITILSIELENGYNRYAAINIFNVNMTSHESIYNYVARFKKLHVIELHQNITNNPEIPIKKVIRSLESVNLTKFIKGLADTSYNPILYNGFHEFLEKVAEEYIAFKNQNNTTEEIERNQRTLDCNGENNYNYMNLIQPYLIQLNEARRRIR